MMKRVIGQTNIWGLACLGGVVSVIAAVLFCLIGAKLLIDGAIPLSALRVMSVVILSLSSLIGAGLPVLFGKRKILPCCLVTATVFFLCVAIMNGVVQKGTFHRIGETAMSIYGAALLACLLRAGKKERYRL